MLNKEERLRIIAHQLEVLKHEARALIHEVEEETPPVSMLKRWVQALKEEAWYAKD